LGRKSTQILGSEEQKKEGIEDKLLTQTDLIPKVQWSIPPFTGIDRYEIYRDEALTELAATVSSDTFEFVEHYLDPGLTYNYFVVGISSGFLVAEGSTQVTIN